MESHAIPSSNNLNVNLNSNSNQISMMTESVNKTLTNIVDVDTLQVVYEQQSQTNQSDLNNPSTSHTVITTSHGIRRQKETSPCYVCGAKANGYNFDQSDRINY